MIKDLIQAAINASTDVVALASEVANIKAAEIAKIDLVGSHKVGDYTIELESLTKIEKGVALFARVSKEGKQLGFGADGSVDIERFLFINPPVEIPTGNVEIVTKATEQYERDIMTEDPTQALLRSLGHTISIVGKEGTKIEQGKRGNTTSTFFASYGEAVFGIESAVWATVHDLLIGGGVDTGDNTARGYISSGNYNIFRLGYTFDTSSIPDTDTISAATFSGFVKDIFDSDNDGDDWINIVGPFTPANPAAYAAADYDQFGAVSNPTEYSTRKDLSTDFTDETYADFALNAGGIAVISKTGNTLLGVREGHDAINVAYSTGIYTGIRFAHVDTVGTSNDPKLVVVHDAAGGGTANNLTLLGVGT